MMKKPTWLKLHQGLGLHSDATRSPEVDDCWEPLLLELQVEHLFQLLQTSHWDFLDFQKFQKYQDDKDQDLNKGKS